MAITIKHAKTDNIADWTQADLDAQIALGNFPAGTVLADIVLPSDWNNDHTLSGTVPIANGGTGQTTATQAINALLPSQTSNTGKVLSTDGTNTSWIAAGGTGTVTSVALTAPSIFSVSGSPITAAGTLALTYSGTALPVANGGSGATTLTGYVKGNGTSAFTASATVPSTDITGLGTMSTQNANSVTITGGTVNGTTIGATTATTGAFTTLTASTSLTTPTVQATNSGGLSLKNSAGTTQMSMGAGGGDNISLNVSTNLNGSNAQIDISPTGTGHVHINPTGSGSIQVNPTSVGTIDNMTIGATTPKNGSFVDFSVTGTTSFDGSQGTAGQVLTSAGTGATPTWTTPAAGTVTSVTGTSPVVSSGGATPAISMPAATTSVSGYLTSTDWTTFNNKGSGTVTSVAVTAPSIFSVAGSPITSSGTIALTYSGTALPIANGGTGQTTASAAFNALSPLTTSGDILYGATSGAGTRLGIGTTGQVLTVSGGLPVWSTISSGSGTVTSVSVVSANGFAGTVATATTTPAITISTSITGVLKGNGTAISAATSGTDYSAGTSALTTGILKSTTTTGALSIAVAADFPTLNQNTTGTAANVTGTVAVANGGTGQTSYTNGQLLIGNTTGNTLAKATLTAGTGISVTNGAGSITIANSAPSISWQSVQTANFTATAGSGYPVNTTSGAITVTLPASPTAGDAITLTDYASKWATNNVTVALNGNKLNGSGANATLATNRQSMSLVYIDATQGWIAYSGFLDSIPSQTYSASYLVVAGGAAGGGYAYAGGGGAGGLLSGTVSLSSGTTYTTTVGAGGASVVGQGVRGNNGSNSVLSGSGITTVTSIGGGGGGGGYSGSANRDGNSGGSGGGASAYPPVTAGSGTSGQGNSGGSGINFGAGAGGGAGAVGGNGTSTTGGTGGAGSASSITGSSVTYAGGGGGAGITNPGAGGSGGGGAASTGSANATSGTANTGGGGGGVASGSAANSGAGGSGVVILSVLTANYTGTTTGSPTVTTSGSNTIIKFTASGSYTA